MSLVAQLKVKFEPPADTALRSRYLGALAADHPDPARVHELAQKLGLSLQDVQRDLHALQRLRNLRAELAKLDGVDWEQEMRTRHQRYKEAYESLQDRIDALRREVARLAAEHQEASSRHSRQHTLRQEIGEILRSFPEWQNQ